MASVRLNFRPRVSLLVLFHRHPRMTPQMLSIPPIHRRIAKQGRFGSLESVFIELDALQMAL